MEGVVPNPINPPPGCAFHPRCPNVHERCRAEVPVLVKSDDSYVACQRAK
jgi:peptide/nickel transport system ATP-binding protein